MTPAQARYVRTETLISALINGVLSVIFFFLVFGSEDRIAWRDLALDSLPQSFAIAFMGTLVPTLLTRKRLRTGAVQPLDNGSSRPSRNVFLRALLVAAVVAATAGLLHFVLLPLGPATWGFGAALGYKALYGLLLGATTGRTAVLDALRSRFDPDPRTQRKAG